MLDARRALLHRSFAREPNGAVAPSVLGVRVGLRGAECLKGPTQQLALICAGCVSLIISILLFEDRSIQELRNPNI